METTKGSRTEWPSGWRGKILPIVGKTMPGDSLATNRSTGFSRACRTTFSARDLHEGERPGHAAHNTPVASHRPATQPTRTPPVRVETSGSESWYVQFALVKLSVPGPYIASSKSLLGCNVICRTEYSDPQALRIRSSSLGSSQAAPSTSKW
jgi:hypothetical protein